MVSSSTVRPRFHAATSEESDERPALSRSKSNEKGRKIKREQESRTRNAFVFLGIMTLIFLAFLVKLRHNRDMPRHRVGLRTKKQYEADSEINNPRGERTAFIPPHSIYSLSVPDITVAVDHVTREVSIKGLLFLAFPISDFHQELSSNQEIQGFLASNYPNANFPVFGLSSLKDNAVYEALRKQLPNAHVQHNFFKFLVDSNGKAIKMFHKKL
eukprot:CAMPEP_0176178768 /NCGR_PEP_ID=MMETSP0120_2-20121206/91596_1 /TAXON_ID=160619 /ORGANISM="Kryptoperidinium foliaceum, Strain CCMP 1326" /LENGTH=213 /DNA_ID=CAMNT_0017516925 /DNA_START=65 /DNA_END=704 /DNA_ORIENTATION=-